jgi:predicted phosphodiesterase
MDASWRQRGGAQVPGPVGDGARLLVAGDTHGNLDWIGTLCKLAARHGCQGVIQLGDFGLWPDQRIWRNELRAVINDRWLDAVAGVAAHHNVWWRFIDGNHDAHPIARDVYPADANGVRPIRAGVLDWADRGAVWEWAGIRFGALGGGVSIDREFRKEGRSWWPTEIITDDDVNTLIDRAGAASVDVLLTHDAPQLPPGIRELADPRLAAACRRSNEQIAAAVDSVQPQLVLHGHYHRDYQRRIYRTWGDYQIIGLSSDQESADPYGGPWAIIELPSLKVLQRHEL